MQAPKVNRISAIIAAMKDIDPKGFASRLNEALDDLQFPRKGKGRQEALRKMFGLSQNGVRKWLVGDGLPKPSRLGEVAYKLGVSVEWLITGKGPKRPGGEEFASAKATRTVPIRSWDSVASADFSGEADEHVPVPRDAGFNAFALPVQGDSMEPEFRDGEMVVVDPDTKAVPGHYVIAVLASGAATFKRLTQDAGVLYLKPLNPQYPIIALSDTDRVIGVVTHKVSVYSYLK